MDDNVCRKCAQPSYIRVDEMCVACADAFSRQKLEARSAALNEMRAEAAGEILKLLRVSSREHLPECRYWSGCAAGCPVQESILTKRLENMSKSITPLPDDKRDQVDLDFASMHGDELTAAIWYPRVPNQPGERVNPHSVRVTLVDVRAADDIRITFDHERNGWKIEQSKSEEEDCWVEVAFVEAWKSLEKEQ